MNAQKINYAKKMNEVIKTLDERETLLLHSCCGPCSTSCIMQLAPHFDITVFYYNPNIDTQEEYAYRAYEQKRLIQEIKTPYTVHFIDATYTPEDYEPQATLLKDEKEGGKRCSFCYALRLEKTAIQAKLLRIKWISTTLSISPHKDAQRINAIGMQIAKNHDVHWLYSDFKKNNGFKDSIVLSHEYKLYRQDYCGCKWSKMS